MNKDIAREYYIDNLPIMEWTKQATYCYNHKIKNHSGCDTCPYNIELETVDECAMKYVIVKLYAELGSPIQHRKQLEYRLKGKSKKCNKCGKVKSSDEFFRYKKSKDGLYGTCKKCYSLFRKKYR